MNLDNTAIHGDYIGFSPLSASRGATFRQASMRLKIGIDGIMVKNISDEAVHPHDFWVHFPPTWVFHTFGKEQMPSNALAVRQHEDSTLAQFILFFKEKPEQVEIGMILGEGIPAILGVFERDTPEGCAKLERVYAEAHQPGDYVAPHKTGSHIAHIDLAQARKIIQCGATSHLLLETVEKLGHNLWTATPEEFAPRMELLKQALSQPDSCIQKAVLNQFCLGARVTGAVSLVVKILAHPEQLTCDVQERGADAAACLLYEAVQYLRPFQKLTKQFGSPDLLVIYEKTGGIVNHDTAELIKLSVQPVEPHRAWTLEHYNTLRLTLGRLTCSTHTSLRTQQEARRALAEHVLN